MHKKILITGITGAGGSYLAEYIVDNFKHVQVFGLGRNNDSKNIRNLHNRAEILILDMCDFSSLSKALKQIKPDIVFNLASDALVAKSFEEPIEIIANNINSTLNLLQSLKLFHRNCKLIHCSTSEVYGQVDKSEVPIVETTLMNPVNPYAATKVMQENLCRIYMLSYQIPIVITRAFTYINPRRADIFSTSFAKQIIEIENNKRPILKHGRLDSKRCLLDIRDIVRAYWLAGEKGIPGEAYNIGSKMEITVAEVLEKLILRSRANISKALDPSLLRPTDVTNQIPDVSKFFKLTGWQPKISIDESLDFLMSELKAQQ